MDEILHEKYYRWIVKILGTRTRSYKKLLSYLDSVEYVWYLPMDANREDDAREFRYRFGYENDYPGAMIAGVLDTKQPSVLEVMVALAYRLEENIMEQDKFNAARWFWEMIKSLQLDNMTDLAFDEAVAETALYKFLERKYAPDGRGGLFTVPGRMDISNMEIWYQAQAYLIYLEGGHYDE